MLTIVKRQVFADDARTSPNLITLAEKMGFNVERFLKITGPSISAGQS
jgi:hypothetical protein